METGIVNEENLSSILRNISQRRRNGVLEITYPELVVNIQFTKGKVVDVINSTQSPREEIVQRLKNAQLIPATLEIQSESYSELFKELNNHQLITEDLFKRVVRHRVLDQLYSLDLKTGAYFVFKAQMVEADKDFAPGISAGQLLLDFVALETDADRFNNLFPANKLISCAAEAGMLSEEEQALFDTLRVPGNIESVRTRSMLSRFHLQDAMLSMYERGVIIVTDAQVEPAAGRKGRQGDTVLDEDSLNSQFEAILDGAEAVAEAELDSDVADNGSFYGSPSMRVKLITVSTRLLQVNWVPNVVMVLFLAAAFSLPLIFWSNMLRTF